MKTIITTGLLCTVVGESHTIEDAGARLVFTCNPFDGYDNN